jgi:hypothetical protein
MSDDKLNRTRKRRRGESSLSNDSLGAALDNAIPQHKSPEIAILLWRSRENLLNIKMRRCDQDFSLW